MGQSSPAPIGTDPLSFSEECGHDMFSEIIVKLPNGKRNITQWIPITNHIKAIVFFAHGLHEHSMVFDKVAHALTASDIACFGVDFFAHGLSEGTKGLITDYRILPNDFVHFAAFIRSDEKYAKLPVFILSHSMGTLVTLLALKQIPDVTAVIFIGTALFPGYASASLFGIKELFPLSQSFFAQDIAFLASSIDPTGPSAPILLSEVTSCPDGYEKRLRDGRSYFGDVMNKTAYEFLKLTEAAKAEVPNTFIPFLTIHGELDQIALVSGSQYLYDHSGTDEFKKSLLIMKNCKHHPIHETSQISKQCTKKVVNYFVSKIH